MRTARISNTTGMSDTENDNAQNPRPHPPHHCYTKLVPEKTHGSEMFLPVFFTIEEYTALRHYF